MAVGVMAAVASVAATNVKVTSTTVDHPVDVDALKERTKTAGQPAIQPLLPDNMLDMVSWNSLFRCLEWQLDLRTYTWTTANRV